MPTPRPRTGAELKIGDLMRRTGVSRSSIQHYLRLGLLPPPRKLGPKLFLFDARHVEALARVRMLREREQLPLAEIRARLRSRAWLQHTSSSRNALETPRRTAILEVATRLFAQRGYEAVRLLDIAQELGLSKAALYQSFDSKEALFVACIDRIRLRLVPRRARDENEREPDLSERALQRVTAVLTNIASYRMLTQLLVTVGNGTNHELASKSRAALHLMVTDVLPDLQQAVRDGVYRPADLELHAYMLWGALMGAGDFMTFVRPEAAKTLARAYLDLMMRGTLTAPLTPSA